MSGPRHTHLPSVVPRCIVQRREALRVPDPGISAYSSSSSRSSLGRMVCSVRYHAVTLT